MFQVGTLKFSMNPLPMQNHASSFMLSMIKLNVTVYLTPELPFTPPVLTRLPQKVVDVVKIMVVLTPDKTVGHLKQQIGKTISIIAKDENLLFDQNLKLLSIRNCQNYVAHNDMILGHAFSNDENIFAICLSESSRPWQYMPSPQSDRRHQSMVMHNHNRQNSSTHQINHIRNHSISRNKHIIERDERVRNVRRNENVTTSESEDSEDTYESSFVEKEDRGSFLDLEAVESDGNFSINAIGSVSSDGSPTPKSRIPSKNLDRRRKSTIQVSESEEEQQPAEFKSYNHNVMEKSEENKKISDAQDNEEVETDIVLNDIQNTGEISDSNSVKPKENLKDNMSSDESSESSDSETAKETEPNQTTEISKDSETDSSSETNSDASEDSGEDENQKQQSPIQSIQEIAQESDSSESESDNESHSVKDIETVSQISPKTPSKRKYSSLSEIASNASNHSSSSKTEKHKKQSSSSSSDTSTESSESDANDKGTKVRRSSLKGLSKDGICFI